MKKIIALLSLVIVGQFTYGAELESVDRCFKQEEIRSSEVKQESHDETFRRMEARSMSFRSGRK